MKIKLTFENFEKGDSYKAELVVGDYKLMAVKDLSLPFMHPFPYMANVWLPDDKRERMAIYKFVSDNSQRIKEEFGLVFEFKVKGNSLQGYENECKTLGVRVNAGAEEVKKGFRDMSLKWHPDMWFNGTDEDKKTADEKFKEIYKAYKVLSSVPLEIEVDAHVTDLKAKRLYDLYDSKIEENKINRMASLRF